VTAVTCAMRPPGGGADAGRLPVRPSGSPASAASSTDQGLNTEVQRASPEVTRVSVRRACSREVGEEERSPARAAP
jgi:hypothetical protein